MSVFWLRLPDVDLQRHALWIRTLGVAGTVEVASRSVERKSDLSWGDLGNLLSHVDVSAEVPEDAEDRDGCKIWCLGGRRGLRTNEEIGGKQMRFCVV